VRGVRRRAFERQLRRSDLRATARLARPLWRLRKLRRGLRRGRASCLHVSRSLHGLQRAELQRKHAQSRLLLRRHGRLCGSRVEHLRRELVMQRRRYVVPDRLPARRRLRGPATVLSGIGVYGGSTRQRRVHQRRTVPKRSLHRRSLLRSRLHRSMRGVRRDGAPRHLLADSLGPDAARPARRLRRERRLRRGLRRERDAMSLPGLGNGLLVRSGHRNVQRRRTVHDAREPLSVTSQLTLVGKLARSSRPRMEAQAPGGVSRSEARPASCRRSARP
jgi:hypothetical protein